MHHWQESVLGLYNHHYECVLTFNWSIWRLQYNYISTVQDTVQPTSSSATDGAIVFSSSLASWNSGASLVQWPHLCKYNSHMTVLFNINIMSSINCKCSLNFQQMTTTGEYISMYLCSLLQICIRNRLTSLLEINVKKSSTYNKTQHGNVNGLQWYYWMNMT